MTNRETWFPSESIYLCKILARFVRISSPGEYFWEFLMGVCRLALQILTLFQTKKCHFPHPFSDLTSKIHTIPDFRPKRPKNPTREGQHIPIWLIQGSIPPPGISSTLKGSMSRGYCCFRSILCWSNKFLPFTLTQNSTVELWKRDQTYFIRNLLILWRSL